MRTETEILADIDSLTNNANNLVSVAPPLSGVALALQNARQQLLDAYKELAQLKGIIPTPPPEDSTLEPATVIDSPSWTKPAWKKKK